MNKKDIFTNLSLDRENTPREEEREMGSKAPYFEKTEVKNSNAAGQGALGRSDQQPDDDDESGKIY